MAKSILISIIYFLIWNSSNAQTNDSLNIDSFKEMPDHLIHKKFDSIQHFSIEQFSGSLSGQPARFRVSFYKPNNVDIDTVFIFSATSIHKHPVMNLNRGDLLKYCIKNN